MNDQNQESIALGQINYNAYCETRNWESFDGKPLPQWENVKEDIKEGWIEGALAVQEFLQDDKNQLPLPLSETPGK